VRLRRRYLPLAAVLGVAVATLPAIAASETPPTIEAVNTKTGTGIYSEEHHAWSPTQVAVMAGGVVTFQNTGATVPHGVVWDSGNPETPSCTGVPVNEGNVSWKGTCTFAHAGTYSFHCYVHPTEMTGKVEVNANGTTTTTTTTPTPTTTTTESPTGSPLVGRPSLRSSQRGGSVKGSLNISQAGAGDRLEVNVFAKSASLGKAKHSTRVRVGRFVRSSVSAGNVSFVVKLNAKTRNALKRHHRLALTVKITLTPIYGEPFSVTRTIVEHA
jgi:plastocyanin